jgi:peptide/nickel transport system permease protein
MSHDATAGGPVVNAPVSRPHVPRVRRSELTHVLRDTLRTSRGIVGIVLTGVVLLIAFVGPFFAPYDPDEYVTAPFAKPSASHLLGGDNLGRDVFSRVLAGGWRLVIMAAIATIIGVGLGALAGIYAGYRKGLPDTFVMRTVDVFLAFPQIVFALLLVSVIGPRNWLLVMAVGLSHAPQVARVLRAATLDVSERDFVKAVEITGVKTERIMTREILPNLVTPVMVELGLRMTYSIVIMAGLSFIGFGLPPPSPNWGTMINENRIGLTLNPWAAITPAIMIAILTIGLNTFTDAVTRVALGVDRKDASLAVAGPTLLTTDEPATPVVGETSRG